MSRGKWKCESIECLSHEISEKEYQARIAEVAKILYRTFCQLESLDSASVNDQALSTANPFPTTETASDDIQPSAA